MAGVWILGENREQTLELLAIGQETASRLGTSLTAFARREEDVAQDYIAHGADEVLVLPPLAEDQSFEAYLPVIASEAQSVKPALFLLAATARLKEMAARLAARLDAGLCSDCIALRIAEESPTIEMQRLLYGGTAVQTVSVSSWLQMATIPRRTFEAASKTEGRDGSIRELPAPPPSAITVLERKPKTYAGGDISQARAVVCVGRGIEKEEDMELARNLARCLEAEIGCTRPISEELHWLPEERCIGLSGAQVKPELYIGLGVSGQIQHVTGMRDAKIICAINSDENAPIFDYADYAIVGNLYEVVPRLIELLQGK